MTHLYHPQDDADYREAEAWPTELEEEEDMPLYEVSGTYQFTFKVQVEAANEDEAERQVTEEWNVDSLLENDTGYHLEVDDVTAVGEGSGEEVSA
jgi:hypothetical protein